MRTRLGMLFAAGLAVSSCSLSDLTNSDELPENVTDPALTQTPEGARYAYNGVLALFAYAVGGNHDSIDAGSNGAARGFIETSGLMTDELQASGEAEIAIDRRVEGDDRTYSNFQQVRGQANQAIGLLSHYLPDQPAFAGHLYALQGYAEIFLAEVYCSGIPLSTLDFDGDYTYRSGSSTEDVFADAVTLFDSALTRTGDDGQVANLARVGRGRALLSLGQYSAAAMAVAAVPDAYRYDVIFSTQVVNDRYRKNFAVVFLWPPHGALWGYTIPDREGANGLDYRTSGDPRTLTTAMLYTGAGTSVLAYHPDKYAADGSSPITLASGVEARLIEAEAALQVGDAVTWLAKLNALRTDGTYETTATSPPDTLWHAGTGGVAGLKPLADPGTTDERVDLLFRERAFWLFLTGHRQGDLRRLIRQYERAQNEIYPVGAYKNLPLLFYGSQVVLPVPQTEFANPLYTGCLSMGA